MGEFWILILGTFFATNLLDKAEPVQLEETPLNPIDEIFGEGWWDNDKDEEWNKLTLEQNVHHQIDRQNTQIGQIEPNSTDHSGQIEPNSTDQLGQIESNSTDQNPPLTESDHSKNARNGEEQNENIAEDAQKRNIIDNDTIKDEFKQKGTNYSDDEKLEIEQMLMQMNSEHSGEDKKSCKEIAKRVGVNVRTINQWKKEFGLTRRNSKNERQRKAQVKRDEFKNSFYTWKSELGQTTQHKHCHSEQKELMKLYYGIKDENPKISDKEIAKMLKIGSATLVRWKRQFKQQQFHPNSVDGHSVEENAAANAQEIGPSNSGSI